MGKAKMLEGTEMGRGKGRGREKERGREGRKEGKKSVFLLLKYQGIKESTQENICKTYCSFIVCWKCHSE